VQQARGSWKQVNLLLAITSFLSFFYGTFLTRSGALDQFSVHSFVSPGDLLRLLLLGFLLFFCALFWGIWLLRVRGIRSEVTYERMDERPFGLFLGIVLFIGSAVIVLVGMSWPILSRTFGEKAASIDYQFYNRALLPVGFFIALLMAITPLLSWRRREGARWKPTPLILFALAAGAALLIGTPLALYAAWRGHNDPAIWLFSAAVGLALITNSVMLFRTARFGLVQTGGWIMHVGFCLCLIGVVSTSRYSIDTSLMLEKGQTKPLYGFNFTYEGVRKQPNGRDTLAVRVKRGEYEAVAEPRSFTHKEQNFNTPYILKFWDRDIYIAPGQRFDESREGQLTQGQVGAIDEGQTVRFERFLGGGGQARDDGAIDIGVALTYSDGHKSIPVQPRYILFPTGEVVNEPVELPGGKYAVQVKRVMPPSEENGSQPTVLLRMTPINPPDIVRFEISTKPWVNVLWLGGYTMFLGGLLAWRKRARVAAHAREHAGEPEPAAGQPRKEPIRPKRRSGLRPEPAAMGSGED
jgi:cytochrome c-type biogenesis protein CcmF